MADPLTYAEAVEMAKSRKSTIELCIHDDVLRALWSLVLAELEAHGPVEYADRATPEKWCHVCHIKFAWPCPPVARMLAVLEGLR